MTPVEEYGRIMKRESVKRRCARRKRYRQRVKRHGDRGREEERVRLWT